MGLDNFYRGLRRFEETYYLHLRYQDAQEDILTLKDEGLLDSLTLEDEGIPFFCEKPGTMYPKTQCHIVKDLDFLLPCLV